MLESFQNHLPVFTLVASLLLPGATWAGNPVEPSPKALRQKALTFEGRVRRLDRQANQGARGLAQLRHEIRSNDLSDGDLMWCLRTVMRAVEQVKRGGPLVESRNALDALGLPREGFEAFTTYHFGRDDRRRIEAVLSNANNPTGVMGKKGAALVQSIQAVKLWQQYGDENKARSVMVTARRRATALGVSADALLELPFAFAVGYPQFSLATQDHAHQGRLESIHGPRLPGRHPQWWSGAPRANLDLLYRKLPELILRRYAEYQRQGRVGEAPTLRIWHVAFEDGSQTFFMAAAIDSAIARLGQARPEMRPFLDKLEVDIQATDHLQKPNRRGRVFRFGINEVEQRSKAPMVLAEFGLGPAGQAKREIAQLERGIKGLLEERDDDLMRKLAAAGKLGQLMGRFFRLDSKVGFSDKDAVFDYRLIDKRWRVEDGVNGGVINPTANGRTIRFATSDVTQEAPGIKHSMDLVVATHVLPYLRLYGGSMEGFNSALRNIARSMRRGSAFYGDNWSTDILLLEGRQSFLRMLGRSDREAYVATPHGIAPLVAGQPRP